VHGVGEADGAGEVSPRADGDNDGLGLALGARRAGVHDVAGVFAARRRSPVIADSSISTFIGGDPDACSSSSLASAGTTWPDLMWMTSPTTSASAFSSDHAPSLSTQKACREGARRATSAVAVDSPALHLSAKHTAKSAKSSVRRAETTAPAPCPPPVSRARANLL
jgi:hypothetical protein